jgi:hypothetical protein
LYCLLSFSLLLYPLHNSFQNKHSSNFELVQKLIRWVFQKKIKKN